MTNYTTGFKCKNCGSTNWLQVPKGQKVKDFAEEEELRCSNCNCLLVEPKEEEEEE